MHNLALTVSQQGRRAEAEELRREVLEIRRRVLGPEHPNTLTSMNNLTFSISNQGRYAEAEKLRREVLEISRRVLGPEHPKTITYMNSLAFSISKQGRYAEAEKLRREVLEIDKRVLGPEHPATLVSMGNLATSASLQGRYAEAEELFREVLELNPEHLSARLGLVVNYLRLAETQKAAGNQEAATASRQQVIDLLLPIAEEERSVGQWGYLGQAFYLVGRWADARKALEKGNELRGDDGPTNQYGPRWWYLAMTLAKLGETEQARSIYDQLVKEMEESPPNYVESEYRAEAAELLGIEIETEEESSGQSSAEDGIGTSS
jgi:tetratricopeptide (TPR) repeat protein